MIVIMRKKRLQRLLVEAEERGHACRSDEVGALLDHRYNTGFGNGHRAALEDARNQFIAALRERFLNCDASETASARKVIADLLAVYERL